MTTHALGAPPPATGRAVLDVLRSRTRVAHERLDAELTGPAGRVADTPAYVRLLSTLLSLHERTDESLRAWAEATPWVRRNLDVGLLPRRRLLYAADLAALGGPTNAERAVLRTPDDLDDARGLAYLYVVAGSSKGARVVLRGLPDEVAPDARAGLSDAAEAGTRLWRGSQDLLTRCLPEAIVQRAADEAEQLFRVLLGGLRAADPIGEVR